MKQAYEYMFPPSEGPGSGLIVGVGSVESNFLMQCTPSVNVSTRIIIMFHHEEYQYNKIKISSLMHIALNRKKKDIHTNKIYIFYRFCYIYMIYNIHV